MSEQARSVALLAAGAAFVVFLLVKLLLPLGVRGPNARRAREQIARAKRLAGDDSAPPPERAAALREAAQLALTELRSPGLAASYAQRAERLDPNSESIGLIASILKSSARFRGLERMLWRRLAGGDVHDPSYQRALQELIELYRGPLKRREVAEALQHMRALAEPN